MLTYQKEKFVDLLPELPEIFYKHWQEVALNKQQIALRPNYEEYRRLEQLGILHIMAARDGTKLAGYVFHMVHPHLHYVDSLTAFTDLLYLRKECTRGMTAASRYRNLIRASEKMLRDLGVQRVYLMTKTHLDLTALFENLGFKLIEKNFSKLL